jgi:hypothetical protein
MRCARIFCGWSKRLKPNESRREIPSRRHLWVLADIRLDLGQSAAKSMLLRHGGMCMLTSAPGPELTYASFAESPFSPQQRRSVGREGMSVVQAGIVI